MKTKLFTIAIAFISMNAFAQITVTDADVIGVGDIIYQAFDTIPASTITPGGAGSNQTWDFSTLQIHDWNTITIISPSGTPYASMYPTANMCAEDNGEYIYLEKTSSGVFVVGVDAFPYQLLVVPLPLVYGNSISNGPNLLMDTVIPNIFFPDSLALLLTMGQAQTIDSVNMKATIEFDMDVDAYGNVTIPMGTYDALRLKAISTQTTEYYVYCTDTLLGMNSGWYSAAALMPNEVTISNPSYQWWTNDPAVKFALVQMETDSGNVDDVSFITSAPSSISELDADDFSIYPIPATYQLNIEAEAENATYKLYDISGKLYVQDTFSNTTTIDLSKIVKGTYLLHITTEKGNVTKKVIVE